MIIVGVQQINGTFDEPKTGREIAYDNTYVHAISGDKDKVPSNVNHASGKWTASYKIRTDDYLESFEDLNKPFDESIGLDVVPNYNQYGKVVGFIRRR